MTKEMIVSSNGHETMVAILEDDLVAEVFVERERHRGVVGNVYKGRVSKVLPGMQSSFIDVGLAVAASRVEGRPRAPAAQDRRAPQGRPGDHRPGGQGAARHQGRAPHLA